MEIAYKLYILNIIIQKILICVNIANNGLFFLYFPTIIFSIFSIEIEFAQNIQMENKLFQKVHKTFQHLKTFKKEIIKYQNI